MTLLLPRLPRMEALSAIALIAERGEASPPRHAPDTFDDVIVWGASGGVRCSARDLDAIRTTVRAHALESGFPEPAGQGGRGGVRRWVRRGACDASSARDAGRVA